MDDLNVTLILAGVVAGAAPVLLATLGETITEKAGLINLSLDGTILLSAMTAFVVCYQTDNLFLGFVAGGAVGAVVAAIVAWFSIWMGQSQVAVGFVLTLMTRDLAYFLGNDYARIQGPQLPPMPVPLLESIPVVGPIFFRHNLMVYLTMALIFGVWWYMYRTPFGLRLRAVGENPAAAYARGIDPRRIQFVHALMGGFLVGLAGALFSLYAKPGWGRPQGAEGTGWIALALVIFGGWHPIRAAMGAYLFAFLQVMGIHFQSWMPAVPAQVFQVAPFPLMIFTLLIMYSVQGETVREWSQDRPLVRSLIRLISGNAPAGLGKPYRPE